MNKEEKEELLKEFQCDYNREREENFAQTFSENDKVKLFFINENQAFTDGKNIIVDPAMDELYCDRKALYKTEEYLKLPPAISEDPWNAMKVITRAQTLHECLHIIYTDFPLAVIRDPICDTRNKKLVMASIANIIEDTYIEAAAATVFDNIDWYLKFGRVSRLFAHNPGNSTASMKFGIEDKDEYETEPDEEKRKVIVIRDYLDYMCGLLLYPMIKVTPEKHIEKYVELTEELFFKGSVAESPKERYKITQEIFELIKDIIPEDDEELQNQRLKVMLGNQKTHDFDGSSLKTEQREGKSQKITVRLWNNIDGSERDNAVPLDKIMEQIEQFAEDRDVCIEIVNYTGKTTVYKGSGYNCSPVHKDIKINEIKPAINLNLKRAYSNIYQKYHININTYNSRFLQLLKSNAPIEEDKQLFGAGISSKNLGDTQKRYWYRKNTGNEVPDLAVLLLIDGSGSMSGSRRDSTMISSVILHEVLKKQGIEHAIVEHRAHGYDPEIDVNVLLDFNAKDEQKLNIMQIDAGGDNRDALALVWAERYINSQTSADNKLIIVISDGFPAHAYDEYYPPVSSQDTAITCKKIINRGTNVIAIALDDSDSFSCYENLKDIYPNLVACNDLKRLTGQLLNLISKQLQ